LKTASMVSVSAPEGIGADVRATTTPAIGQNERIRTSFGLIPTTTRRREDHRDVPGTRRS